MEKTFAVLHNQLLESYYFACEANPAHRDLHMLALTQGLKSLIWVAQCAGDFASAQHLVLSCNDALAGDIPRVLEVTV